MAKKSKKQETYHYANTNNSIVKAILAMISKEINDFQKNDKDFLYKYFNKECAYTGEKLNRNNLEWDHFIPSNLEEGGLTILGNMVPTTKSYNKSKSGKNSSKYENEKIIIYQKLFNYPVNYYDDDIKKKLQNIQIEIKKIVQNCVDEIIEDLKSKKEINQITRLNFEEKKEVYKVITRLPKWYENNSCIPFRIISLYIELKRKNGWVKYNDFKKELGQKNLTNLSNLLNINDKNYGKVFDLHDDKIIFWKPIEHILFQRFKIS